MAEGAILVPRKRGVGMIKEVGLTDLFNGELSEDLVFDATVNERHSSSAKVTKYPVEEGADKSDHVVQDPDTLQVQGIWVDTPPGKGPAKPGRARELWTKLLEFKRAGQTMAVVTGIRVYQNMQITSVDVVRTPRTGFSLPVSVSFQQVEEARQELRVIPAEAPKKERRHGGKKKQKGKKPTQEPSEKLEGKSSTLYDAFLS